MDPEKKDYGKFSYITNIVLLSEYLFLLLFLGYSYHIQQISLKKPSSLVSIFFSFLFICCLLRILLFLDIGLDYTILAYTIILLLALLPYFSAASIMIYLWYYQHRLDIYMLTRWDLEVSFRFLIISRFKYLQIAINLGLWISFFILTILSDLQDLGLSEYSLSRGMNILEAIISFIIMMGLLLAGICLGRRVRSLVNHTPQHILPWMVISIFTTAYRFVSHLLVLFSSDLWGFVDKSEHWYFLHRSIFLIIDVNLGEIIPIVTFVFSSKVCISFIKSTNSIVESSDTSSIDYSKMLYK